MSVSNKKVRPGEGLGVCSPKAEENFKKYHTCFSKEALLRIAKAWNDKHARNDRIATSKQTREQLWRAIDAKMKSECGGSGKEWCWVGKLEDAQRDPQVQGFLRPKMPAQWYKKPNSWLSNWDIQKVMRQYEEAKDRFHYKFLGVLPVDFAEENAVGKCISEELCHFASDVPKLLKKGIHYVGMITNLDRHDEPGSHWTSTFMCIDPSKPSFGAYYYDSVARPPPKEIAQFILRFKESVVSHMRDAGIIKPDDDTKNIFETRYSSKRHQLGNSECGVFSMVYQIRWLEGLEKNPKTVNADIIKVPVTDSEMNKYFRHVLFSPNVAQELPKKA